ncbi:MAG: class II aldolase/adducin family protein [Bryobacterales bacterium]|nr:class II aldolase/adducin family protein [Bryobacterales bacterium]
MPGTTVEGEPLSVATMRAYDAAYQELEAAWQVRLDLAVAHRWAARWRWNEGVVNHFTALVPGYRDRFFAIPYGVHWEEVKARDFCVIGLEGEVLEGDGEIELTSLLIHGAMHRDLPQATVVLHTHQPHITAFTCLEDQTIEMCSQHMLHFPGRIAYLNSYGPATERSIGDLIREALRDRDILLMANHGVTVCAPTVAQAFDDLYTLDRACELQLHAMASGRKLRIIDPAAVAEMAAGARAKGIEEGDQHFRALRRMAWRAEPDLGER